MATPDNTTVGDSATGIISRRGFLSIAGATGAIAGTGAVSAGALKKKPTASVTFKKQKSGGKSVMMESVTMSKGGFVAIHDSRLLKGKALESVIGVSKKLESGTHKTVKVMLFDVPGGTYKMSRLEKDQTLIAMPHLDTNSNGTYDFLTSKGKKDGPYTKNKKAVIDKAKITVKTKKKETKKGEKKPTASVTFKEQTSGGKSVVVQSVRMSDGGFVTIHDSSLQEGEAVGSAIGVSEALSAGSHEGVAVPLFEVPGGDFDTSRLETDQTLIAMPHRDTNGNDTYEFVTSDGAEDGPYTDQEGAIVDEAMITVKKERKDVKPQQFSAELCGENEVPPVDTDASGEAHFTVEQHEDRPDLHYELTVSGPWNGCVTQAHIHLGGPNENGPVVAFLFDARQDPVADPEGTLAKGTITADDLVGPLEGKNLAALVDKMTADTTYANVHTTEHPAGEIRGQIESAG